MDPKIAARMIAVLALGAAMIAAVVALRGDGPEDAPAQSLRDPGGEPLSHPLGRSELSRCRDIGPAALENAACRKAWAESRRRFFETARPAEPTQPKPERFGPAARPATGTTAQPPAGSADEADTP